MIAHIVVNLLDQELVAYRTHALPARESESPQVDAERSRSLAADVAHWALVPCRTLRAAGRVVARGGGRTPEGGSLRPSLGHGLRLRTWLLSPPRCAGYAAHRAPDPGSWPTPSARVRTHSAEYVREGGENGISLHLAEAIEPLPDRFTAVLVGIELDRPARPVRHPWCQMFWMRPTTTGSFLVVSTPPAVSSVMASARTEEPILKGATCTSGPRTPTETRDVPTSAQSW